MASTQHSLAQPDPRPDLPKLDIGLWSLEKHELLRRYVAASWAARSKWPACAFIDLYCGPGRVLVRERAIETDGGAIVAWRASAATRAPFSHVVVADLDENSANACAARLAALNAPATSLIGPALEIVDKLDSIIPHRGLHLAYLDPFNLEHLPFEIIRKLAAFPNIDIVVHFSVMDLQREIELDFDRDASRLEAFAPGWKAHVNVRKRTKLQARTDYVSHWLRLAAQLGFGCSRERPLMTNSKNGPLYRMMFLMRHRLADKLWNDIAKSVKVDLDLFD